MRLSDRQLQQVRGLRRAHGLCLSRTMKQRETERRLAGAACSCAERPQALSREPASRLALRTAGLLY